MRELEVAEEQEIIADRYLLRRVLARSDRAEIHAVEHTYTGRVLSLKLLLGPARTDPEACARMLREVRVLGRIRHPALLAVLDAGESPKHGPFAVSEMPEGRTLDGVLAARSMLPVEEAMSVMTSVGEALAALHAEAVSHAALSPASILLPARVPPARLGGTTPVERTVAARLVDLGLTPNPMALVEGPLAAMGYASPERLAGGRESPRSDVYALGAIAYECLTGRLPEGPACEIATPSESAVGLPAAVSLAILRALGPEASRPEDAGDFVRCLRQALATEPPPASLPPRPSRRVSPRACYMTPVRVVRADGHAVDGRSEDISAQGLMLVGVPVYVGERVSVRLAMPLSGRVVTLGAAVRWQRGRSERLAAGLEFADLGAMDAEELASFVRYFAGE